MILIYYRQTFSLFSMYPPSLYEFPYIALLELVRVQAILH
jgi:hypothetical protein